MMVFNQQSQVRLRGSQDDSTQVKWKGKVTRLLSELKRVPKQRDLEAAQISKHFRILEIELDKDTKRPGTRGGRGPDRRGGGRGSSKRDGGQVNG